MSNSATSSLNEEELDEKTVSTYPVVLPTPLWRTSAVSYGGVAYIFGGQDANGAPVNSITEFSPHPGQAAVQTLTDVLPTAVHSTTAVLHQSKIYVMGGQTATGKTNAITIFDPSAPEGQRVSSYPQTLPKAWAGMSGASDGQMIYLFGGHGSATHDTVMHSDPQTGTITISWGVLPSPRTYTSAVFTGMDFLVFGGDAGFRLDEVVRYDPLQDSALVLPERLPFAVHSAAAAWNGERAIVFGGNHWGTAIGEIQVYDPVTSIIETYVGILDGRREAPSAVWIDDHVDVFGGRDQNAAVSNWIIKFTPPTRVPSDTSPYWGVEGDQEIRNSDVDPTADELAWDTTWPPHEPILDNETLERLASLMNETEHPGPFIFEGPPPNSTPIPEAPGVEPAQPNHANPIECGAASKGAQDACHVVFMHGLAPNFLKWWGHNPKIDYDSWVENPTNGIDSLRDLMFTNGYVTVAQMPYYGGECKATGNIMKSPNWAWSPHNVHFPTGHKERWQDCGAEGWLKNEHGFNTKLNHLASHTAWWFYDNHRWHYNDVVAHSMGGMIIRYALAKVSLKSPAFPSHLTVEDVVSLGTPHKGHWAACGIEDPGPRRQVAQLCPKHGFMYWMRANAQNAGSHNGVDWTVISSNCDKLVYLTGHGMEANHKVAFLHRNECSGPDLGHSDFYQMPWIEPGSSPPNTDVVYNNWGQGWGTWTSNPPNSGWWIVRGVTTDWG